MRITAHVAYRSRKEDDAKMLFGSQNKNQGEVEYFSDDSGSVNKDHLHIAALQRACPLPVPLPGLTTYPARTGSRLEPVSKSILERPSRDYSIHLSRIECLVNLSLRIISHGIKHMNARRWNAYSAQPACAPCRCPHTSSLDFET